MELYGSNRIIEMVKLYEETNFKSERDSSHLFSASPLPSSDKEIEIQKYPDKNNSK
jgi:hypothetical protein